MSDSVIYDLQHLENTAARILAKCGYLYNCSYLKEITLVPYQADTCLYNPDYNIESLLFHCTKVYL